MRNALQMIGLVLWVFVGYEWYQDYERHQAWDYSRAHPTQSKPSPIHYELSDGYFEYRNERSVVRIEPRCAWVDYATYIPIPCFITKDRKYTFP